MEQITITLNTINNNTQYAIKIRLIKNFFFLLTSLYYKFFY